MAGCSHGIAADVSARTLQTPGAVVNLETIRTVSPVVMVQAVSFGQEIFDRAGGRDEGRARCFIQSLEIRWALASPHTVIVHRFAATLYRHARQVVRQVEQRPGPRDGEPSTGIKTEEVHARPFCDSDIRPNV